MKFKSPSNKPVYIALLSGHSAYVGNEWRELPLLMHREALAAGCITDNMDDASIDAKVEMTLVDGEVLFDSVRDYQMRLDNQREKARLVSKMLASNEKGEATKPFFKRKKRHFHCDTIGEEGSEGENSH